MRTRPIGSIIGAIGGLAFVLVNAGAVPGTLVWRITAAVGFVAILCWGLLREPDVEHAPASRTAMSTYLVSVAAMGVAIPAGAAIISNALSRPNAALPWVVFVVGAHFVPFARAFQLPIFRWLSASLIAISIIGAVATLALDSTAAAGWTGVSAGFVLLICSAIGTRLGQHATGRAKADG